MASPARASSSASASSPARTSARLSARFEAPARGKEIATSASEASRTNPRRSLTLAFGVAARWGPVSAKIVAASSSRTAGRTVSSQTQSAIAATAKAAPAAVAAAASELRGRSRRGAQRGDRSREQGQADEAGDQVAQGKVAYQPHPELERHELKAWNQEVGLDREVPVRRLDEEAPADPMHLARHPHLVAPGSDVLDHRVREDDVELPVIVGKVAGVPGDAGDRGGPGRPRLRVDQHDLEVLSPAEPHHLPEALGSAQVENPQRRGDRAQ